MALPVIEVQDRFRVAFELADAGIGLMDGRGRFFEVNQKLCQIFGLSREELLAMSFGDLPVPHGDAPAQMPKKSALNGAHDLIAYEKGFLAREGSILWTQVSIRLHRDATGKPAWFVASFHDITEGKVQRIALEQQASLDTLTKALNRMRFEERARIELLRAERHRYRVSMAMIDLDHFKNINDTLGHAAGDQVLSIFGNLALDCMRLTDTIGRWGGEEFLILFPDTGPSGARRVAERLRTALDRQVFPSGAHVTASIGVVCRREGESFRALVDRADITMYSAKQAGRNRVAVDDVDQRRETESRAGYPLHLDREWKARFGGAVPDFDAEHRKLFRISNRILAVVGADKDEEAATHLIDELLAHLAVHFLHVEQMMEATGFPQSEVYRQKHQKLLAQARELAERCRLKQANPGAFLGFIINDVVARHIIQEVREYFPWMSKPEPVGIRNRRISKPSDAA